MTNGANTEVIGLVPLEEEQFDSYERRRLKAAIALAMLWSCTAVLHLLAWGQWIVYGLTLLTGAHLCRLLLVHSNALPEPLPSWRDRDQSIPSEREGLAWPYVS
ncbi:MAG: glycosyltransferase family 2 protein, partial [Leptolyngbya sp. SIO1D8]|nr:glycosyltransferase family 2 protein [Leptolyngbya sp. SIO1D8]